MPKAFYIGINPFFQTTFPTAILAILRKNANAPPIIQPSAPKIHPNLPHWEQNFTFHPPIIHPRAPILDRLTIRPPIIHTKGDKHHSQICLTTTNFWERNCRWVLTPGRLKPLWDTNKQWFNITAKQEHYVRINSVSSAPFGWETKTQPTLSQFLFAKP